MSPAGGDVDARLDRGEGLEVAAGLTKVPGEGDEGAGGGDGVAVGEDGVDGPLLAEQVDGDDVADDAQLAAELVVGGDARLRGRLDAVRGERVGQGLGLAQDVHAPLGEDDVGDGLEVEDASDVLAHPAVAVALVEEAAERLEPQPRDPEDLLDAERPELAQEVGDPVAGEAEGAAGHGDAESLGAEPGADGGRSMTTMPVTSSRRSETQVQRAVRSAWRRRIAMPRPTWPVRAR